MKPSPTLLTLIFGFFVSPAFAQTSPPHRRAPPPPPTPNHPPPVPEMRLGRFPFKTSKTSPASGGGIWPPGPPPHHPPPPLLNQDGVQWKAPDVFDNLIHKKEMPVTIGVFVMHGR